MTKRPLIGVSANRFAPDPKRPVFKGMELHYAEANMMEALYRAGGLPVLIPDVKAEAAASELAQRLDGVVLAGGADVCPESYGRERYDPRWPGDGVRDRYEIALVRAAERAEVPLLGICRGLQLLNVAFGGTLYQDIGEERPSSLTHRDWDAYEQNVHDVSLEPGSWLEKIYKAPQIKVNTVHHQGIRDLATAFRAVAFAPDGVIEAIEDGGGRWIRAVQWHPEWSRLDRQGASDMERVLSDFVGACGSRAHSLK